MTATAASRKQPDPIAEVAAKIAEIGPRFDEQVQAQTRALYAPLVKPQSSAGVVVTADVAYGPHARQKLDIYRPQGRERAPVLVYVPGGGFVGGDKNGDGVFYGNLGTYFARHGWLTIVINYRLAPEAQWPAGAADVGAAIAWAKAHAAEHGGDPARLIAFGQSAGATHVATYLFHPDLKASGVTAAILMSGPYEFAGEARPNVVAYLGADASRYADRSPLTHVGTSRVPLLLSVAEFDPPVLAEPTFKLAAAVTLRDGRAPQVAFMTGHNHVSTVQSLGSDQDDVGETIRAFLARF